MEAWKKKIVNGITWFSLGIISIASGIYLAYNPVISKTMYTVTYVPWYVQAFLILIGIIFILGGIYTIHQGRQIKVKLENAKKR